MKVKLAFAAAALLSVVACSPQGGESPSVCGLAAGLPPYTVSYEDGSSVFVPAGSVLVGEDGSDRACAAYLRQYAEDVRNGKVSGRG